MRYLVALFYLGAFVIGLIGVASIPKEAWTLLGTQFGLYVVFVLALGFCGVLIAFWVAMDEEEIARLKEHTGLVEKKRQRDLLVAIILFLPFFYYCCFLLLG